MPVAAVPLKVDGRNVCPDVGELDRLKERLESAATQRNRTRKIEAQAQELRVREEGRSVHVKPLAAHIDDRVLKLVFQEFGEISSAKIMRDATTCKPRGFGFVNFVHRSSAQKAVSMTSIELEGVELIVSINLPAAMKAASNMKDTVRATEPGALIASLLPPGILPPGIGRKQQPPMQQRTAGPQMQYPKKAKKNVAAGAYARSTHGKDASLFAQLLSGQPDPTPSTAEPVLLGTFPAKPSHADGLHCGPHVRLGNLHPSGVPEPVLPLQASQIEQALVDEAWRNMRKMQLELSEAYKHEDVPRAVAHMPSRDEKELGCMVALPESLETGHMGSSFGHGRRLGLADVLPSVLQEYHHKQVSSIVHDLEKGVVEALSVQATRRGTESSHTSEECSAPACMQRGSMPDTEQCVQQQQRTVVHQKLVDTLFPSLRSILRSRESTVRKLPSGKNIMNLLDNMDDLTNKLNEEVASMLEHCLLQLQAMGKI